MPLFLQHNVRLVGIGLEELGVDEFVNGGYFAGDLYLDTEKANYKALGYKRFNLCTIFMSLFSKVARDSMAKGKKEGMKSNLKGNPIQNGGALIVKKGGGQVLLSYRQENPADHVSNWEVLKALGISGELPPDNQSQPL